MKLSCKRCEQDFLTPEKIAALASQILLDPSLAADEKTINERLASCKACEALRNKVLCFHCGCFVIIRARPALSYCPHPAGDKWSLLCQI